MSRTRKTFLTNVTEANGNMHVELTLIDSHYKSSIIDSVEDIISMTLVYNDFLTWSEDDSNGIVIVKPFVHSDKVVSFSAKVPNQGIESAFINTLHSSVQIEL